MCFISSIHIFKHSVTDKGHHFYLVLLISLGIFPCQTLLAQDVLTIEEAVAITLKNNYDIRISQISEQQAAEKMSKGYAGYYPQISLNGGYTWSMSNSESTLEFGGLEQVFKGTGAISQRYNAGLSVQYGLYQGKLRVNSYKQLQELHHLSELQTRVVVDNLLFQLLQNYFNVAQLQDQVVILGQVLEVSRDRLHRAQVRYDLAAANRLEVLNARVAFDADSLELFRSDVALANARRNLNYILNRELDEEFTVEPPETAALLDEEIILEQAIENSPAIRLNKQNLRRINNVINIKFYSVILYLITIEFHWLTEYINRFLCFY